MVGKRPFLFGARPIFRDFLLLVLCRDSATRIVVNLQGKNWEQARKFYVQISKGGYIDGFDSFRETSSTPQKFNIAPEKWWLEDYFPIWKGTSGNLFLNNMAFSEHKMW